MKRRLHSELRQTKPFGSIEEEVYLQVLRTAQVAHRWCVEELKPLGISPSQFNVLRILRGARPEALSSRVIAERMIERDPDLTRMLDRLEAMGLVEKSRSTVDRRVVEVTVTKAGADLAEKGAIAVRELLAERFSVLGPKKLEQLANLLDQARGAVELNEEEAQP
jgi:DNA-binding MarR family transcriptional regulator